uniref:PDZ domain-containing protein n=1 Tax=Amphiprion ocellaris TaxID=80972 RepID=A0AAQ5X2U2_AMPOC
MCCWQEVHSPESEVIVKTAKDGCAEGLVYGGGGREGIFIKQVVPESPASKSLKVKEGDQILSATVYFDNVTYEDAIQILEHAQAYKLKLCLKRKPDITETEPGKLPGVELKDSSAKIEIPAPEIEAVEKDAEGSPSKFKMSTFKRPKFGAGISTPEVRSAVNTAAPNTDVEGKFKMPKFGMSMPKVKGPEFHLGPSKKDVDVTTPEVKAGIYLPDTELETPSTKVAIKTDVTLGSIDVTIPEARIEVRKPELEIKPAQTEGETDGQRSKFKMPTLGMSVPKVKGPEVEFSLSKTDIDITLPEAKAEVTMPGADIKEPSAKVDFKPAEVEGQLGNVKGSPSKFKLPTFKFPKFGVTAPHISAEIPDTDKDIRIDGGDMHISDIDVTLPETKTKVKLPDVELKKPSAEVEVKGPEIKVVKKEREGSPSKFKMPTFKLPKFGVGSPSVTAEVPDVDKGIKIDGSDIKVPEEVLTVSVAAPSIDAKGPSIDITSMGTKLEGKEGKFKMPNLGFSGSQAKGPDIDLSLSKKDIDVSLPEAQAEVKFPDVELKKSSAEVEIKAPQIKVGMKDREGSPSKFKMPTFKLPKFGAGTPSVTAEGPDVDKDVKIDGVDIKVPEEALAVSVTAPSIDTKGPSIDIKTTGTEHEGKGIKFKLPSLGFSGSQVKGPDFDLSLSKKDVDVTLPEAKGEVKLPDVELKKSAAEVEIKAPEIKAGTKKTEVSPSKFKMPTFKLPKFGAGTPSVTAEGPDVDKSFQVDGADIKVPEEVLSVTIAAPSIDTKGPSIDIKNLSLSKKDVDVTLPEAKGEVKLPEVELKKPSAEVEVKAPEIKVETKDTDGSPSKFKMPTFKLPKFGVGTSSVTAEGPDMDKDVKIDEGNIKVPEQVLAVNIAAPSIDTKAPSTDIKISGADHEGKGGKFKLPSLGFSMSQAKAPDIDLSLSKKDVDVTLPEAKAGTKKTEVSPSKFKMPTFKLPKFSAGTPSVTAEGPDVDKDIKVDGADIKVPEEVLAVTVAAPSIDTKGPSIDIKSTGTEHEGKGSKFKMPSLGFSMSQAKQPDIDLSLSKKDVDVTLPEAKGEMKKPSVEVEVKAPEIKVGTKDTDGSPSKFNMPTFKLPKFGAGTPSVTAEGPDMDKDVKIDGADIKVPEEVIAINIAAPSIDTKSPSIDIKSTGTKHEGKGSKFNMPSLGFSMSQAKRPDIDLSLSKKDVDVTLPEAKGEIKLPDVKLKKPSAEVEAKAPEIKVETKDIDGSPSKFKMPTFKLPKFGAGSPSVTAEGPDMDKGVKIDGAHMKGPQEVLSTKVEAPSIDIEGPSVDIKTTGALHEGKGSKFKLPSLGFAMSQAKGS